MSHALTYCILDFEATCSEGSDEHEVIEFPSVIVDPETMAIWPQTFQCFVKPKHDPKVTPFCHKLTGITQEQVDGGITFPEALKKHEKFLSIFPAPIYIITCGDWDLRTMMPIECSNWKIKPSGQYTRWINIKKEFSRFYQLEGSHDMVKMLEHLKLPLIGRHHSGIDDCGNIARIVVKMLEDGWTPGVSVYKPKISSD